jgi:hypothetical protein
MYKNAIMIVIHIIIFLQLHITSSIAWGNSFSNNLYYVHTNNNSKNVSYNSEYSNVAIGEDFDWKYTR